jgi:hypothetical protein
MQKKPWVRVRTETDGVGRVELVFLCWSFLNGRFKIDLALCNTDQNQTTQTTQHLLWSYSIYCDKQTEDSRLIAKTKKSVADASQSYTERQGFKDRPSS